VTVRAKPAANFPTQIAPEPAPHKAFRHPRQTCRRAKPVTPPQLAALDVDAVLQRQELVPFRASAAVKRFNGSAVEMLQIVYRSSGQSAITGKLAEIIKIGV